MTWLKQSQERFLQYSEVFKAINTSQTGFITIGELRAGIDKLQGSKLSSNISWEKVFANMDTNHDGLIDYQEFILACSSYENIVNERNVRDLFDQIDLNGDGCIQMSELQAMFQEE
jgi:calcium-dependent protein kinase